VNFKANDTAGTAQYDTNPITAGTNSMVVYLKGAWGGTFNKIKCLIRSCINLLLLTRTSLWENEAEGKSHRERLSEKNLFMR